MITRTASFIALSVSFVFAAWCVWLAPPTGAAEIQVAAVSHDGAVDFEKEVLPILRRSCLACHSSSEAESDLVLETPQAILKGGYGGPAAVAGKSQESPLLVLASHRDEPVMPPEDNDVGAKNLTPQELGLIKLWIDQGAKGDVTGLAGPVDWQPLPPGVNPVYCVAITDDGQYVAAGRANQIFLYHVPSKRELGRLTDPALLENGVYNKPGVAHLDLVQSLAFSPDGQVLASGGYRNVKLWRRGQNVRLAELAGVDSPARSLAVAADGRWAAIGQENGKIRLFDLQSGKLAHTLEGHTAAVTGLSFGQDGTRLASGSLDKSFRLWNPADGKQLAAHETPAAVTAVALVAEDKQLATGGQDNVIRTWELGEEIKPLKDLGGHGGPITSLAAIPPNGAQLLSGSEDGTVRHWDVNGGNQIRQMAHGGPVQSVAVRADGQRFASAGSTTAARLWNAANGQQVAELKGDFRARLEAEEDTRDVALAKRMIDLCKADLDEANKRKTAEEENGKKAEEELKKAQEEFTKKQEAAKQPLVDKEAADKKLADAQAAATKAEETAKAAADALANAADDDAKKAATEAKQKADQELAQAQAAVKQAEAEVNKLAAPAQKALDERNAAERSVQAAQRSVERAKEAVQLATSKIPEVDATVKNAEQSLQQAESVLQQSQAAAAEREKTLSAIAFSPDGSTVAAAGAAQDVYTWDSETGVAIDRFSGQGAEITLLAFNGNGDVVAIGKDNSAVVWDNNPVWRLERMIGSPDSPETFVDRVTALDFSHDGRLLATGGGEPSRSGELKIFNPENGELIRAIDEPHSDTIFALEFSRDGKFIASCAADRFMKTFDVETGKFNRAFEGHTHHVLGVSWSADGRTLASSGADKVVKVWNSLTGDQQRTITGFSKEVTSIKFVADTTNVVASCGDSNVHMKRVDNGGNVRTLGGAGDFVYSVDVSGDGKAIVAGGLDSVVRIWNDGGQEIAKFEPPAP